MVKLTRCETSFPFLTLPLLELDVERTKELSATFALVTSNNDTNATTFKVLGHILLKLPGGWPSPGN